jgi:hypothetical protein
MREEHALKALPIECLIHAAKSPMCCAACFSALLMMHFHRNWLHAIQMSLLQRCAAVGSTHCLCCVRLPYSASSIGSQDFRGVVTRASHLQALGVAVDIGPEGVGRCLQEVGIGFMFAPRYRMQNPVFLLLSAAYSMITGMPS